MHKKNKYWQLFLSTFKLSACTFGGGFVIIPLMRARFVKELHWIEEEEMLDLTAIAQSSPGSIAINASILVGFHVAGIPGALITVVGSALPPLIIISIYSAFYQAYRSIKYVSMGEKPDSLEPFYPDRMAKRILGMGDVVGIIEKAQEAADAEQLAAAARMLREGFTMNDMLDQMKAVKKMGGMKGILGMLPGGQRALNQMGGNLDEGIFDKNEAIIMSMTKEERLRPSIINGQRRARIAKGAGVTPTEVNSLMKHWG